MRMHRFGVALMVAAFSLAHGYGEEAKTSPWKSVLWPAEDLKWVDVPSTPIKMAVLWGDPARGAHGAFHRFPGGFAAPVHHHTGDHAVVVVSGRMTLTPQGEAGKTLGAGSYFAFTGKKSHGTKCEGPADCVLFIESAGVWDVVMDDAAKAAPTP